jgi:hypothetical protein
LLAFPPVVRNLASNLSWTSELGDDYFNQPPDVMNAMQEMCREARKHRALKSNDQIKVIDNSGCITIEPKDPDSRTVYLRRTIPGSFTVRRELRQLIAALSYSAHVFHCRR